MKRTKTLIASILGMIVGALAALLVGVTLSVAKTPAFVEEMEEVYASAGLDSLYTLEQFLSVLYSIFTAMIIFGIIYFAFSLAVCLLSKADIEKFHKFQPLVIITIVIGFIGAAFSLFMISSGFIGILILIAFVLTPVLLILDLKDESLQYKTYINNATYGSNYENNVQNDTQINVNDYNAQPAATTEESVDEKLTRLLNLKEKGLITDEDYARMRETIINSDKEK